MRLVATFIGSASERQGSFHGPSGGGGECEPILAESGADAITAHSEETWELLKVGHNRGQLEAGVRLLMDAPMGHCGNRASPCHARTG